MNKTYKRNISSGLTFSQLKRRWSYRFAKVKPLSDWNGSQWGVGGRETLVPVLLAHLLPAGSRGCDGGLAPLGGDGRDRTCRQGHVALSLVDEPLHVAVHILMDLAFLALGLVGGRFLGVDHWGWDGVRGWDGTRAGHAMGSRVTKERVSNQLSASNQPLVVNLHGVKEAKTK